MPKFQPGNPGGPGRPRKAELYAPQIRAAEDQIADALPELIGLQFELARGVTVQEVDPKTGGLKVYTRAPDRMAIEYLLNRILGKPVQATEVSGPDGAPIPVSIEDALIRIYGDDEDDE